MELSRFKKWFSAAISKAAIDIYAPTFSGWKERAMEASFNEGFSQGSIEGIMNAVTVIQDSTETDKDMLVLILNDEIFRRMEQ